jgi:hypothetical protein
VKIAALWLACVALAVVCAALAQTASGPAGLPAGAGVSPNGKDPAPVIPLELQLEYFRTDGILSRLRAEIEKASAEYEAAIAAMVKACGEGSAPTLTQDKKRLFCVAQPKPEAR